MARGAIAAARELRLEALAAAGVRAGPPPFAWDDAAALEALFAPLGFAIETELAELAFTERSAESLADGWFQDHPLWIADRIRLERCGAMSAVRARTIAILEAANEDRQALRVSSPYVLATLRR